MKYQEQVKSLVSEITKTIISYNKEHGIASEFTRHNYNDEAIQQERDKLHLKVKQDYKLKAEVKQIKANEILNEIRLEIQSKTHPKGSSKNETLQMRGELERSQAFQFLSGPVSPDSILREIENGFESGRIDYANTLVGLTLSKNGEDNVTNPLVATVKDIRDKFKKDNGILDLESDLKEFTGVLKIAGGVVKGIEENTYPLFTNPMIGGLSNQEMMPILDGINESMRLGLMSNTGT